MATEIQVQYYVNSLTNWIGVFCGCLGCTIEHIDRGLQPMSERDLQMMKEAALVHKKVCSWKPVVTVYKRLPTKSEIRKGRQPQHFE